MSMLVAVIFVSISAIIMSLWCSNERRIIQSEQQNVDGQDESQQELARQYVLRKL